MLKVENLNKQYGDRKVVKSVGFSFKKGEIIGLLGPNGAGKTTSFYMTIGIVKSDKGGHISLDGHDITHLPIYMRARLGIGYLPQEPSIFRSMTVEENILAILEMFVKDKKKRRETADELMENFSISHIAKTLSSSLSGGERRRLEIARLLAMNPSYILLDEPFAGVDPIAVSEVRDIVNKLRDRNIGILITDHNVYETLKTIDRAYIIHDGSVICHGSKDDILNNQQVRDVYLGSDFNYFQ